MSKDIYNQQIGKFVFLNCERIKWIMAKNNISQSTLASVMAGLEGEGTENAYIAAKKSNL